MMWVLLAVLASDPTIDKALDLAERGQYEEADKLIQPLLDKQDPLAHWARWQIQLIRTRTLPPTAKKVEDFEELKRRFQSLSGVPEYAQESLAQTLEAQARTLSALNRIDDAVAALQQSEANYAALRKKPLPESQIVRVTQGYAYVVSLLCSLRTPPLAKMRERVAELRDIADSALMFYGTYPQSFECANYASDMFRLLAMKIDSELANFQDQTALLEECRAAWAKARSWARLAQQTLLTANGTAKELRLRSLQRELDAVLGHAEWLQSRKEPLKTLLAEAAGLVKEVPPDSPPIQLRIARLAILREDISEAIRILGEIPRWTNDPAIRKQAGKMLMSLNPKKPEHLALIADELKTDGKYLEAIEYYRKAGLPELLFPIGECYLSLDRYIEAAAAFSQCRKHPKAKEAALLELRILNHLQSIDPQAARKDELLVLRDYMAQRGWLNEVDQRNRAIELEQAGKFPEAAKQWKDLSASSDPSLRQEALSRAGTCHLKAGEEKEAAALFEQHLQEARTQPGNPGDLIVSVYNLARLRDPKTAGKAIEQFLKDNPSIDLGARLSLAVHALDAYIKAGDLRSAQAVLDYVRENRAERNEEYARALGLLAWGYDAQSEDVSSKNPKLSEDYFNNAVQLYTQSLNSVAQPVLKFDAALSIAARTFQRAKVKGDVSLYSRARTLFEHVKTRYPEQVKDKLAIQIDWHIGLCYLNEKNFDSALEFIKRVSRNTEPSTLIDEAVADCWHGKAMQAEGKERINHLLQANIVYNDIINTYVKNQQREEGYFRNLCKRFETLFQLDRVELRNTIEFYRLKGIGGKWDENKWGYQTKIREIEKRLAEVDPSFRISPE